MSMSRHSKTSSDSRMIKIAAFLGTPAAMLIMLILIVVLFFFYLFFFTDFFKKEDVQQRKMVQQITVVAPPPPPPPPPPEEIEEPEVEEEVIEEEIEDAPPDEGPDEVPAESLAMDADGSAGSDAFGIKAKKGGRGLLDRGGSFKGVVRAKLEQLLRKHDKLKYLEYSGVLTVKIGPKGEIEHFVFKQDSGDERVASYIEKILLSAKNIGRSRPFEANPVYEIRLTNSFSSGLSYK